MHQETISISNSSGYACPIAGLQIEEDAVTIGPLFLVRFNRAEWEMLERSYVYKEWYAEYYTANPVFVYSNLANETNKEQAIAAINHQISLLISAFHLHKYGYVVDPIYTVKYFYDNGMYHRSVGPYRIEYLAAPLDNSIYPLKAAEYETVNAIYQSLTVLHTLPNNEFVLTLIHHFNLSFLPALSPGFSLNTLYTIVEMLYGKINPTLCSKTNAYQRALAMLTAEYGSLQEDDEWKIFYTTHIHPMRNIVHHHKKNTLPVSFVQATIYLQESLRLGIRMLMRLYIMQWQGRYEILTKDLPAATTPKELLNVSLEKLATGDNTLLERILEN